MSVRRGKKWEDKDFDQLGWNNNRVYGFMLPGRRHKFKLFLDYAIQNPISDTEIGKWELVPVELVFADVVNLRIDLDIENFSEIGIVNIERGNRRPTPNGKLVYWDYVIDVSPGNSIAFSSTSFTQTAVANSVISDAYDLDREKTLFDVIS